MRNIKSAEKHDGGIGKKISNRVKMHDPKF
jgi:hypothetical protein